MCRCWDRSLMLWSLIGNDVCPLAVTARLSAWLECAISIAYSSWLFLPSFCRFLRRNRCLWTFFFPVVAEAVISAILVFSMGVVSAILHLMAELVDFGDVWTLTAFICRFCRCRWSLCGSACLDFSGGRLSTLCISLSTETEVLLLLETAACRSGTVAVVIDWMSADDVFARRRAAGGGALMTFSAASLPLGTTYQRSVDARVRVVDSSWRCAVLERFWCVTNVSMELSSFLMFIGFILSLSFRRKRFRLFFSDHETASRSLDESG